MKNISFLIFFLSNAAYLNAANTINLNINSFTFPDPSNFEYLEDSAGLLTIYDVLKPEISQQFVNQSPDEFSSNESYYWVRFTVTNHNTLPILIDTHLPLRWAILFYPISGGKFTADTSGLHYQQQYKKLTSRVETFYIPRSEFPVTYYLRVLKLNPGVIYFSFKPLSYYVSYENIQAILIGIKFGIIGLVAIYSFVLFGRLRQRYYLFLGLFIVSFGIYEIKDLGYLNRFIWWMEPDWNTYLSLYNIPYSFCTIFLLLYINNGLQLTKYLPLIFWTNVILVCLKIVFLISGNLHLPILRESIFDAAFLIPSLIGGYYLINKQGNQPVFFLLSIFSIFIGMTYKSLPFLGFSNLEYPNVQNVYIASVITGIALFSLMLSYKVKRLEKYKVQAKEKLILKLKENEKLKEKVAQELEFRVKERTTE
ncbi:MAG: 7TM diverse intracellular signaling domain-containing protein [Bacteroidota bacterium]|nr:7TM diverse intracellular signaling domain-containing protein [Bacteroidota bacterium]